MTWNAETRILKADDTYAIEAKLAPSDDVANWWEVDELPPQPDENIDYLANEYLNTEPEE